MILGDASAFGLGELTCGCSECVGRELIKRPFPANLSWPMIVCPNCGSKRCARAASHEEDCEADD